MEESQYITGYEKYRQYFETIKGMCDKEHLRNVTIVGDEEYEDYILDNGLHVKASVNSTWISDVELDECSWQTTFLGMDKVHDHYYIMLKTDGAGSIDCRSDSLIRCYAIPTNTNGGENESREEFYDDDFDMADTLKDAIKNSRDEGTKEKYRRALALHNKILEVARGIEGENVLEDINLQAGDERQLMAELENLSVDQLEEKLREMTEQNKRKKQELEDLQKAELIKKIMEAQEEGKRLNLQIDAAKAKDKENR